MMKEWQKTRDVAGYPHSQILRGLIALRSTDSFAPSELRGDYGSFDQIGLVSSVIQTGPDS
jgi:hypothetical protein